MHPDARIEIRQDIIENSQLLLKKILAKGWEGSNDTPFGRMIYQLEYFIDACKNDTIELPMDNGMNATLKSVSSEGYLNVLVDRDPIKTRTEIRPLTAALYWQTDEGRLLAKKPYYRYIYIYIALLKRIISHVVHSNINIHSETDITPKTNIKLSSSVLGLREDLDIIKAQFKSGERVIYQFKANEYKHWIDAEYDDSLALLPHNGRHIFLSIDDFLFNGIRPDNWLTPADAQADCDRLQKEIGYTLPPEEYR